MPFLMANSDAIVLYISALLYTLYRYLAQVELDVRGGNHRHTLPTDGEGGHQC